MVLSCHNIYKSFGEQTVLENCSFHIEEYDKAAIVGINGAGKSTLLKIIAGELSADNGSCIVAKDKQVGYLPQQQVMESDHTIYDELLLVKKDLIDMEEQIRAMEIRMKSHSGEQLDALMQTYSRLTHEFELNNGYSYKSEVTGILKGLGFLEEDFKKPVRTLSGGQKTRVALGKILLNKPEIIMLDEPTNHLDMESISWLETYLLNYKGAVLIVSHDRYFLDRISNKIIELDFAKATTFTGNYSAYSEKKAILRTAQWNAYMNQQNEIKHQEEVIRKLKSFNREKSIRRAESREKMLDKIEVLDRPLEHTAGIKMQITPRLLSGTDVLSLQNVKKSFGKLTLFNDLNFEIKRGERVALIGNNGTGKTTILKMINQILPCDEGIVKIGTNVHIGYYDQEHNVLHKEKSLFDEIADDFPTLTNTEIRNTLAAFLFTGDEVYKRIMDLSGGERGRVSLAKLMLSEANFLILDEPTNHLDIASKEILENVLNHYEGTILYVSHDRYFINKTATRILDLEQNTVTNYIGNYDYYLEKKNSFEKNTVNPENKATDDSLSKLDWKQQKEQIAQQRKLENELKRVEDKISQLEDRSGVLDLEMSLPENAVNVSALQPLLSEKESISEELDQLYDRWNVLSEQLY
ncbi:MAG: ABC-F family ATP-binding cassette domain-containing protein [Lachnospiraceae bacterium]|nr:ABC-F family ATP-binding cassette domain-containing protein [Lachnospiraceae bacterium]MDD3659194.1 ABC-F family ATP-binding cassette domain-containing protein [Lachnospiraceae bacterium]